MASTKLKNHTLSADRNEYSIHYQIINEQRIRQVVTEYQVFPDAQTKNDSLIYFTPGSYRLADQYQTSFPSEFSERRKMHIQIPRHLFEFMEGIIEQLRQNGKIRTSETYKSTLSSFKKFLVTQSHKCGVRHNKDIPLKCLNTEIMEAYQAWQQSRGVVPNTISFYTRILRAVYNRAVDAKLIDDRMPFRRVYTGIDKTKKRALPLPIIHQIKTLNLSKTPALDFARDMFLMSFYLRGMSFIDMAYLKKSSLRNGYATYRRRKTGQQLTIEWKQEMQLILDKYPENESQYLLPIIQTSSKNEYNTYRKVGNSINHNLKKIARIIGLQTPLTLYVARHSWASAARAKGIPLSVISEGMGHESESTTQIYLASLDASIVDKANSLIIQSI